MSNSIQSNLFDDPVFYVYLIGIFFFLPSFLSQFILLIQIWKHKLINGLSANLLINIILWTIFLFLGLVIGIYVIFVLESPEKNAFIIFYYGMIYSACSQALAVSVAFMSIDRIYAILYPLNYKMNRRNFIITTMLFCGFYFSINIVAMMLFEPPLPRYTACKVMACLITTKTLNIINTARTSIGIINVIISTVFGITLLRHRSKVSERNIKIQLRKANNFVFVSAATELTFSVLPQTIHLLAHYFNISLNKFGPFLSMLGGVDAFVTAAMYRYLIINRIRKVGTIVNVISKNDSLSKPDMDQQL